MMHTVEAMLHKNTRDVAEAIFQKDDVPTFMVHWDNMEDARDIAQDTKIKLQQWITLATSNSAQECRNSTLAAGKRMLELPNRFPRN